MANKYLKEAEEIRNAITVFSKNQTDETLVDNKSAFPLWNGNGVAVKIDEIYRYSDNIYKVIQSHTTQADWTPDKVPALYQIITPCSGYPEWSAEHGAYAKGAKCSHNGKHWISNVDGNIWEPGATGVYTWDEWTE